MSSDHTTPWVKARASDQGEACVEQRRHAGMIEVRDTKDAGTGPVLRFTPPSMPPGSTARGRASSTP